MPFPFASSSPSFVVETARLGLTLADPESDFDCQAWLEFRRRSTTVQNLEGASRLQHDAVRQRLISRRMQYETLGFGNYVVWLKPEDSSHNVQVIGVVTLAQDRSAQYPDVGFALYDEFIGRGYASEAASTIIKHVQDSCNVSLVFGYTEAENLKSRAVLERIGMRLAVVTEFTAHGKQHRIAAYVKGEDWSAAHVEKAAQERVKNMTTQPLTHETEETNPLGKIRLDSRDNELEDETSGDG